MGVAAYWRGSQVISRGLGFDDAISRREKERAARKPRPEGWGSKALDKAVAEVRRHLKGAHKVAAIREERLDVDATLANLVDYLWTEHKMSRETVRKAVEIVRAEHL